mgnify:CR=1 FL=1
MLPDVSEAIEEWATPHRVKTVTKQTVDFVEQNVVTGRNVDMMVQVAQKEKLSADQIDWSRRYLLIHSLQEINNGELVEYGGEDYKIIDDGDWLAYGYVEAVAEQTKLAVVQETA